MPPSGSWRLELLQKCIQVIDTFDPRQTTVDAYMDDTPILKEKWIGETERKFVHQVFYGCIRYQKFLKLFTTSLFYRCPVIAVRSEQTLYAILGYLLFFRLEELGVTEFKLLLMCGAGSPQALYELLQYTLNVEELERWVKVEWCKLLDVRYVEEEIIGKLQSFKPHFQPLLEEMEIKATGSIQSDVSGDSTVVVREKKCTTPKPFNITQQKPKPLPEPEPAPVQIKARLVPPGMLDRALLQVEEEKVLRLGKEKARVVEKYGVDRGPKLTKKCDDNEMAELARRIAGERYGECTFKPPPPRKYVPPPEDAVVRPNIAAILREDALLKKKQAADFQLLRRYEEDLRDASQFYQWQDEMKEKDQENEDSRVQQRIEQSRLALDEAIEAHGDMVRRKHADAGCIREDFRGMKELQELDQRKEMEVKQKCVRETMEDREKIREAEENAKKQRDKIGDALRKQKEEVFERKRLEDEQEMERRRELIRQIKAIDKPVDRTKVFDPTEQPTTRLLEEMSLAELRERLRIMQARRATELEEKRERQLQAKSEKEQELKGIVDVLAKNRNLAKEQAQQRRALQNEKKREAEEKKQRVNEQKMQEVQEKIARKRRQRQEEEQRLKNELREMSIKRQFLNGNADGAREATNRHGQDTKSIHDVVDERLQRAKAANLTLKEGIRTATALRRTSLGGKLLPDTFKNRCSPRIPLSMVAS